jgi:hypothetical protein
MWQGTEVDRADPPAAYHAISGCRAATIGSLKTEFQDGDIDW